MKPKVKSEIAPEVEPGIILEVEQKLTSGIVPVTRNKRRWSGAKWLVWSGVLTLITVGGWLGYSYYIQHSAEPVTIKLVSVEKGTVKITASESGTVEYGRQQTLKSPGENLTVEQVNVAEGDRASAGETLLILRDREAQQQEREQILENTQNELTLARNNEKVAEVQQKLRNKEARVRKLKDIFQLGAISETNFLAEQEQLDAIKAELRDAQLELNKAGLDVQKGQAKLQTIQQKLGDRLVTSPIDGVVLDVQVKNGDGITTNTQLLTLGDSTQEMVKLQLNALNATKVKLNQVAIISVIGPSPEMFMGRVISLSPQATTPPADPSNPFRQSSGSQAKVDATVILDEPSGTLIPGSQVNVEIVLQQRRNVVTLPIEALQRAGNKPFVWVNDGRDRAKKQPVTLGLEGLELVEVTSGLQAGDQIVLAPPTGNLTPNTPMQIAP